MVGFWVGEVEGVVVVGVGVVDGEAVGEGVGMMAVKLTGDVRG